MRHTTWLWLALILATPAGGVAAATPTPPPSAVQATPFSASGALFVDDDQVLVEVRAGKDLVTDALSAYSSRNGVYLPLGEFSRALDLAIIVYPPERRAAGWILHEGRKFSLDLASHTAKLGDQSISFTADQATFLADEIYVRTDLMEKLLPVGIKFDARGLILRLDPHEPLPFQQRLDRERRRASLGGFTDRLTVMKVQTPYLAYTPPSFDISLNGGAGAAQPHATGEYDLRAAGDLAYGAMQFFASSDESGRLDSVRFTLGRRDNDGHILGPLKGTDAEFGDTFTPSLDLGAHSEGGRGFFFSSGPVGSGSVFSHLDLRGELQDGWQVEVYVNEVLQGSQTTANQGRYEFLNVPLSFGSNTVRLVFYGPHGEQREEVRHYNFGAGQLDRGQLVVNFGAVQSGENVFQIPPAAGPGGTPSPPSVGQGDLRAAAELEYGLSTALTVTTGFAQYTPVIHDVRQIWEAGLRTSLFGVAVQADAAKDLAGGEAGSFNLAGRIFGASFKASDNEYRGIFFDENQRSGLVASAPLLRSTEISFDFIDRLFKVGSGIPMTFDWKRDERQDGSTDSTADARLSATVNGAYLASTFEYSRTTSPGQGASDGLTGEFEASRLFNGGWQLRGGVQYQLLPQPTGQSFFLNVDHALSTHNSLRLSLSQALSSGYGTNFQLTDTWRLRRANLAITTGFDSQSHDFRVGLQLSFGLAFDPSHHGYRVVRPGATAGGDAAFSAFVDANGNGRRDPGETPVANVPLESQGPPVKTDGAGQALLTGLGAGSTARIRIKTDALDDPYTVPPADVVEFTPRPGRVTQIYYGFKAVGEVQLRLTLHKSDGARKGVSGLDVQLVSAKNIVVAEGRTEYDGTMYVEKLPVGVYTLRIEAEQSKRLGLGLGSVIKVTVPPQGGYIGNVEGEVVKLQ